MTQPEIDSRGLQLRALGVQHWFHIYLLSTAEYPLPASDRERYLESMQLLLNCLDSLYTDTTQECLLQVWKLHHEAASKHLSGNGPLWVPIVGAGIWPHKQPPHVWTVEEFKEFEPGIMPRPPVSMVFRLKGKQEHRANVLPLMGGRGVLILAGLQGDPDAYYAQCNEYFRTFIKEPLHLAYPFFFPLIDANTLPDVSVEIAEKLLGGVQYYIRESCEDGGILIFSRLPLEPVAKNLDWQFKDYSLNRNASLLP